MVVRFLLLGNQSCQIAACKPLVRPRKGTVLYMTTPILPHNHGDIHNVLEAMPSKDTCADMASAFKQLCDGTRLQIFWLLCHSEECVLNISAAIGMSAPAVSHHLRCLKDAGLITGSRHGKEVHYHIANTTQAALLHHFVDSYLHTSCPGEFDSHGISHSHVCDSHVDHLHVYDSHVCDSHESDLQSDSNHAHNHTHSQSSCTCGCSKEDSHE